MQIENYEVCCCAHDHSDDCLWYKFYQRYPDEAHELHSGECQCNELHPSRKKHSYNCEVRKKFHNFMLELKKNPELTPQSLIYEDLAKKEAGSPLERQPSKKKSSANAGGGLGGGLAALNLDEDSDMEFMQDLEEEAGIVEERINDDEDNLILCCCKKNERHDETMKFICLYKNPGAWRVQLFAVDRKKGTLIDDEDDRKHVIPHLVDKRHVLGRQTIVHEILDFLITRGKNHPRILAINGSKSQCGSSLAKFAVKYATDRYYLEDGAFYINIENQKSESTLLYQICKKIGYIGFGNSDLEQAIEQIKNQRILFLIDNCDTIIDKGEQKFLRLLKKFIDGTISLKIILITNREEIQSMIKDDEETFK